MASASDTLILIGVVVILLVVNVTAGALTNEFSSSSTSFDESQVLDVQDDFGTIDTSNSYVTLRVFAGVLAWSFGLLPVWLDVTLWLLRATGYVIIAKFIRGVAS